MKRSEFRRAFIASLIELYTLHLNNGIKILAWYLVAVGATFSFYVLNQKTGKVAVDLDLILILLPLFSFAVIHYIYFCDAEAQFTAKEINIPLYQQEGTTIALTSLIAHYRRIIMIIEVCVALVCLAVVLIKPSGFLAIAAVIILLEFCVKKAFCWVKKRCKYKKSEVLSGSTGSI